MTIWWRVVLAFLMHETLCFELKHDAYHMYCLITCFFFYLIIYFLNIPMSKFHAFLLHNSLLGSSDLQIETQHLYLIQCLTEHPELC